MHITHFCGALKGGPLSAVAEWTRQQVAAGHCVSLIFSPVRDPVESFRNELPPQVALYPVAVGRAINPLEDLRALQTLTSMLRQINPDILHLHSSKAGALGRVAARLLSIPSVYSTHGMSYLRTDVGWPTRLLFFLLEWLLGPLGSVTVACSPSELKSMHAIPGRKITIPNGIALDSLPAAVPGAAVDSIKIALCGRITAQKNPHLAQAIAAQSPSAWRWCWLGDGEMRAVVEAGGRIKIAGWRPRNETLTQLGASDIMLHTSSWEGMPIAMLEAMAMGLPVVATDAVGNRDLIVHGVTGFVARDAKGLLQALEMLADSPDLRRRMGEAGRQRVTAEFDQSLLVWRWQALYAELDTQRSAKSVPPR